MHSATEAALQDLLDATPFNRQYGFRVQTLGDLANSELILAGTGNETAQAHILQHLTGGRIRIVLGYPGGITRTWG